MNSNRFKYSSTWVHLSKLFKLKHETNNSLKLSHLSVNLLSHPLQQLKINQPTPQKKLYSSNPRPPPPKKNFSLPKKTKNRVATGVPRLHRTVSHGLPRLVRRRPTSDEGAPSQLRLFEATLTRQAFHRTTEVASNGSGSMDRWMDGWVGKGGWNGGLEPPVVGKGNSFSNSKVQIT